jgi:hypothetical protein
LTEAFPISLNVDDNSASTSSVMGLMSDLIRLSVQDVVTGGELREIQSKLFNVLNIHNHANSQKTGQHKREMSAHRKGPCQSFYFLIRRMVQLIRMIQEFLFFKTLNRTTFEGYVMD